MISAPMPASSPTVRWPGALRRSRLPLAVAALVVVGAGTWLAAHPRGTRRLPPVLQSSPPPFLWRAERPGTPPVWLVGTIHVPDARVLSLPPSVTAALEAADHVVTEIPLDLEAQLGVAPHLTLPTGTRLRDVLGEARFTRLSSLVTEALSDEAPMTGTVLLTALDQVKPWAALAQIALLDYLPDVLGGRPTLDARLYEDARRAGKRLSALETVAEQATVFDAFTLDEQVALLDGAIAQAEAGLRAGSSPGRALVDAYLAGDEATLLASTAAQGPDDAALAAKFARVLLRDRNRRMIERFEALRDAHPADVFFVAVGTLHLVGADSLPMLLTARGYRVDRVVP